MHSRKRSLTHSPALLNFSFLSSKIQGRETRRNQPFFCTEHNIWGGYRNGLGGLIVTDWAAYHNVFWAGVAWHKVT
jgi:hypothetical protein